MSNIFTKKYLRKTSELSKELAKIRPEKEELIKKWQKETQKALRENKNWFFPPDTSKKFEIFVLSVCIGIPIFIWLTRIGLIKGDVFLGFGVGIIIFSLFYIWFSTYFDLLKFH